MYSSFSTHFVISAHKKNFCSFFLIESATLYPGTVISCEKYYQSTVDFPLPQWQIAVSEKNYLIKLNFGVCRSWQVRMKQGQVLYLTMCLLLFSSESESYFCQSFSGGL